MRVRSSGGTTLRRRELRRNLLCVSGRDTERSKPRPAKPPPDSRYGGKLAEGLSALRPAAPKRAVALQLEPAALWEAADSDDDDDTDNAPGPPRKAGRGRGARKAKEHEAFGAHCERLSSLLVAEWEAELAVAEARLREWPLQRLQREGLVLCGLAYAREPDLHANVVLRFALHAAALLPYTALGAGDCVQLTRGASASGGSTLSQRPPSLVPSSPASSTVHLLSDDSVTAVVLERTQTLIKVALTDTAAELMESQPSAGWRMDVCANAVSHERMLSAVASFGAPRGDSRVAASFSPLQRALMGDGAVAAAPPPWLTGAEGPQRRRQAEGCAVTAAEDARLNPSQAAAIRAALQRTLTHVQGPPGAGKTATLVAFAAAAVRAHPRSASPRGPILLACAPSNLSADALAEGIDGATPASCVVVRVGSSVRVSPRLARLSLAYRVASHPRGIEAASLRAAARDAETPSGAAALRAASRDAHAAAIADVLAASTVVVSTCTGAGDPCLSATRFPWLVVDEAAQATEPACLVPLALADACLLVGDTAQLPPTVLSGGAGGNALSVSLPQRVAPFLPPMMLDTQFRMHPAIAAFPSAAFYASRLRTAVAPASRPPVRGFAWPRTSHPVAFLQVSGEESRATGGASLSNDAEAAAVARIVDGVLEAGELASSIGVITFYAAQARHITDALRGTGVEAKSVDGFQGREAELIILSCVRANSRGAIGFAADARRVNVALTRARRGLIVLGDRATLASDPLWAAWLASVDAATRATAV